MNQEQPPKRNIPMLSVGILLYASHLLTLGYFVFNGTIFDFWDSRWLLFILFMIILLVAGMGLLFLSELPVRRTYYQMIFLTGVIYMILSALIYAVVVIVRFQGRESTTGDIIGMATLFLFFFITGYIAIKNTFFPRLLRYMSYGYLTMFGAYLIALTWKYLFQGSEFVIGGFIAEVFLLVIGGLIFGYLFTEGMFNRRIQNPPPV